MDKERDLLLGVNRPRSSNFITGSQYYFSEGETVRGKNVVGGPPIYLSFSSPGVAISGDSQWSRTYSSSPDSVFSIINGRFVQDGIDSIQLAGIFKDGSVNADDDNLWKRVTNDRIQQIQYIASKTTTTEGFSATDSFGEIEEARGIGIRVPSIAAGYGRTIDGLPTDPTPQATRKNDDEHKLDRATWKYGPIEYRWDYRKNVWSAYNDLIADNNSKGLGTWVFGTNEDESNGFPFLRGRLQDVWTVRQPYDKREEVGSSPGVQTGEIFTKLSHRLFDEDEEGAAALSSIFIIPHKEKTSESHAKGNEYTLGSENTGDGEAIDILTTTHFFMGSGDSGELSPPLCGPFYFVDEKTSELDNVACRPRNEHYFIGKFIYQDSLQEECPPEDGSPPTPPDADAEPPRRWVPAITIDECELVGGHFQDLIWNDVNLGIQLSSVCNDLTKWTEDFTRYTRSSIGNLSSAISCVEDGLEIVANNATAAVNAAIAQVVSEASWGFDEVQKTFDDLVAQINEALAICCAEASIDGVGLHFDGLSIAPLVNINKPPSCPQTSDVPPSPISCNICHGVEIWTPCATSEKVLAGSPCEGDEPPELQTMFGNHQAHESKTARAGNQGQGPAAPSA